MFGLLNFFEDVTEGTTELTFWDKYGTWIILAVLIVGMVLMMVIPQRKQKKRAEEMMSRLAIGSIVTTIGGIVGEVVELDYKHIWLLTGTGDNKTTMQFVRQAIHSIAPAPGSPEAVAEQKAAKEKEDEIDEVK